MDAVKNIILTTPEEALEKVLSPFIREQFPAFMREDYGKLILVIKAYYEWMEQHGNVGGVISRLDTVYDLDANADQFYEHFKNTYLLSFPEMFAQDTSGNKPNKKTLLKKIREFYGSKGTESAYKFLFKILYDADVEFYYPKTDVIKASDGQWIEPKSVKTTLNNGDALFAAKGGRVTQVRDEQTTGSAFVESVVQYTLNGLPICEFFLSDIVGDFVPDLPLIITKPDGEELKEVVYSVLGQFFVELPGKGYRVGDTVSVIEPVGGTGFSAKVDQVGLAGSIKKLAITNSGVNYSADVLLNIFNERGNRSAKVIALRGAVTNYPGYFSGNRGKVSSDKKIFDGHYYQDFSYELKSVTSFDTYFSVLKKLVHPAGMRMFGSILLKDEIDNLVSTSTQASFSKTPVIGKYTPYSLRTYNNLRKGIFLPNQVRGATLQVWLSTHNVLGNSGDGVTADRTQLGSTAELALGVRSIYDISNGLMYQSPATPNETFWTVPRIKEGAVNTHPSLVFRPQNNSGSDLSGTSSVEWRSYGYWSGLTVGALNLFSSHSYFVVAKARLPLSQVATPTVARHLLGDLGGHHGIVVGSGSNPNRTAVVAYVYSTPTTLHRVEAFVPNSEWFLVSSTHGRTPNVNGSLALFLNGVCAGIVTAPKPTQLFTGNSGKGWTLGIGMRTADEFSTFDGEIAEVVCFQGDLGETDRQKVEGYLAHKYGLAGKLPSNHPYKNVVPGGSYSSGLWYGNTGDYYPLGYNPYIGSTAQVGRNGTTAPLGSLFFDSGLGYTFTVANEHGITSHNPTGSPLGSTAAWWDNGASGSNKETVLDPSHIRGLELWLKPENIGVCGARVNGASMDVWIDASPRNNHALPPTWDKFTPQAIYSGVTVDKLRPTLSIVNGISGISLSGGKIFSPWVSVAGTGKTLGGLGISFAPGGSGERLLTSRHFYLKQGITLNGDCDLFIVFKPDGSSSNQSLVSSNIRPRDMSNVSSSWNEYVIGCRDWNAADRNASVQNSTVYYSIVNGVKRYYPIVGPLSFRPYGGTPTLSIPAEERRSISYDPHVAGLCFDRVIAEVGREPNNTIFAYYNGDRATNRSPSTGLAVLGADGNSNASQIPVYEYPISFGRFGAFVWGNVSVAASGVIGSTEWLDSILAYEAQYSFAGVVSEIIVFNRKLSEQERQIVYGYLSRKYAVETTMPDSFKTSHNSAYLSRLPYWEIEQHPSIYSRIDRIPVGSEFSGITLQHFFALNEVLYKSAGTRLLNGTVLGGDTYDTATGA